MMVMHVLNGGIGPFGDKKVSDKNKFKKSPRQGTRKFRYCSMVKNGNE